jgi:hypothetical protein
LQRLLGGMHCGGRIAEVGVAEDGIAELAIAELPSGGRHWVMVGTAECYSRDWHHAEVRPREVGLAEVAL